MGYIRIPFATDGDKAAIAVTTQPSGDVSFQEGYTPDYSLDPTSGPPAKNIERDKMNQLFFDITTAIQQYQQFSVPDFITTSDNGGSPFSYSMYARVRYDPGAGTQVYESTANSNTALPTDTTKWKVVNSSADAVFYGTTTNTGDAYSATMTPAVAAYEQGKIYIVQFNAANTTTTVTLDLGDGAESVRDKYGANPSVGFIAANSRWLVTWDGTNFRIMDIPAPAAASPTVLGLVNTGTISDVTNQTNTGFVPTIASLLGLKGIVSARVTFDGTTAANLSGTYSRTGTTVTITATAHNQLVGHRVYCDFTTGSALDGLYVVQSVIDANNFTITTVASGSTSGNVTLLRRLIRSSYNVNNVAYNSTGYYFVNFASSMGTDFTANVTCEGGGNGIFGNTDQTFGRTGMFLGTVCNGTTGAARVPANADYMDVTVWKP